MKGIPMDGSEYRKTIKRLGLNQVEAARFLGVNETTSRRWISDRHPIPACVEMLLHTMVVYDLKPDDVVKRR